MTLEEWVQVVSEEFDLGPIEVNAVLDLARDVAHRVSRPAAPLTCLLVGLAAGTSDDVDTAIERVRRLLPPQP